MAEFIKRQDAIDVVAKQYRYESDRMTALQDLQITKIDIDKRISKQEYRELKAEIENSGIPLKSQKVIIDILKKEVKENDD